MFQMMAFIYEIIDSEGIEKPCPDTTFLNIIGIADIVIVSASFAALYINAENISYRLPVVVECLLWQIFTSAHFRALPPPVYLLESQPAGSENCIHEPDVSTEQVFYHSHDIYNC